MPRVNLDDFDSTRLGLVGKKGVELGKAPRVHAALAFTFAMLDPLSDIRQVLKHDGTSGGGNLHNAFGEDVIMVFSLPKQLARKLFQVPFGRFGAFLLKCATQAEHATFLFFPLPLTQEVTGGGDCWTIEAQVNAHDLFGGFDDGSRNGDHNVQKIAPLVETQVSRAHLAAKILACVFGNGETHLNTSRDCGQTTGERFPLDPRGTLVVADGSGCRVWTAHRLELGGLFSVLPGFLNHLGIASRVLFLPCESRFHRFSRLDTSRAHQLSRKIRILCTQWIVRLLMQFHTVTASGLKAGTRNLIKAGGMFLQRSMQDVRLF